MTWMLITAGKIKRVIYSWLLVISLSATSAQADFSQREDVKTWLDAQPELGYDKSQVLELFRQAEYQQQVIPVLQKAPERKLVWQDYRARLLVPARIQAGKAFMADYSDLLADIETKYGVEAEYIAAIVGVETNYGGYTGKFPVLDTLLTLAFEHPRRQDFFQRELGHFLRLSYEHDLPTLELQGSPAGAIGTGQFMPSSYVTYGVDGNADGRVDLLGNMADALASVANYLARHGWQYELPVMKAVTEVTRTTNVSKRPAKGGDSLFVWWNRGIDLPDSWQGKVGEDDGFRLYAFSTHNKPEYMLASANFYAITRYNHSLWYARLVSELAAAIK